MITGHTGKILLVDLSSGSIQTVPTSKRLMEDFLGTRGMSAKLLYDYVPTVIDPFDSRNVVVFSAGPLTGTPAFAPSGYFASVSPLTGAYTDSGVRGHFAANLKLAGYDAFVIRGKAKHPVFLWITNDKVEIRDATFLWGQDSIATDALIKKDLDNPRVHIASIGPAGENLVRYACINSDLYRQAGRGGVGAVWGSKNLKAIAIKGNGGIQLARPDEFMSLMKEMRAIIERDCEPLRAEGTLWLVDAMNKYGLLPVMNFRYGVTDKPQNINGAYAIKSARKRNAGCYSCSVMCSNTVTVRTPRYGKISLEGPEYETLDLLGPNCGLLDFSRIASLNLTCDRLGVDTMSVGATISFAMELYEKGIITKADTDGMELKWGDAEMMEELLDNIALRRGFGNILAEGSARAAKIIGNGAEKYAMHVKGMELPGYDPRGMTGMALAYATSDRGGCHLRAWTIYEEVMGGLNRYGLSGKAALVAARQNRKAVMDSLGICEQIGLAPVFLSLLGAAKGWDVKAQYNDVHTKLLEDLTIRGNIGIGARIYTLSRAFNTKFGKTRADDTLPDRFFEEPLMGFEDPGPKLSRSDLSILLDDYYQIRGWNKEGVPTKETLEKYGLEEAAADLY
jgi:aldehyde:ferredoxin oxidoreductase